MGYILGHLGNDFGNVGCSALAVCHINLEKQYKEFGG
jgi:hypothetical protein